MDTKLINEKEFLKIKKDLDNILSEIDKIAGQWINVGNAISGIGIAASFFLPPLGLAVAAGGFLFGQHKKKEALENKKAKFYEALPQLKNTAKTKQKSVKNYSILFKNSLEVIDNNMLNDCKLIISETNIQNKEHLIKGLVSSFKSYCYFSYMLRISNYVLDTYKAWLNEEYSADYDCPSLDDTRNIASEYLYNNSDFQTIITENPSIGSLLIIDNNDDEDIDFFYEHIIPHIAYKYAGNRNHNDFIFVNRRKEILKNTKLLKAYEYCRSSNAHESLINHYKYTKFVSICIFIVSFLLMIFFERGAYSIGIIKFGLLSLLTSSIITGIFILFWYIAYNFLYNIIFKFYRRNIILAFLDLILMATLLLGSPTLYYTIYNAKFKNQNIEYYNSILNEVNNIIENKDFESAFIKTENLYLLNIFPIADIFEAVKVKSIRKESYNNISTNFFNDIFIRINRDMDYSNYNYLVYAYKNKDKYYKKISNKDYKKEIKERIDKMENEIDEKRHNYLLMEVNAINNLINQNKNEEAKKLINNIEHLSKSKIVLSNEKKFIFFDSKIPYKEYWENQKKELLDKINN